MFHMKHPPRITKSFCRQILLSPDRGISVSVWPPPKPRFLCQRDSERPTTSTAATPHHRTAAPSAPPPPAPPPPASPRPPLGFARTQLPPAGPDQLTALAVCSPSESLARATVIPPGDMARPCIGGAEWTSAFHPGHHARHQRPRPLRTMACIELADVPQRNTARLMHISLRTATTRSVTANGYRDSALGVRPVVAASVTCSTLTGSSLHRDQRPALPDAPTGSARMVLARSN